MSTLRLSAATISIPISLVHAVRSADRAALLQVLLLHHADADFVRVEFDTFEQQTGICQPYAVMLLNELTYDLRVLAYAGGKYHVLVPELQRRIDTGGDVNV